MSITVERFIAWTLAITISFVSSGSITAQTASAPATAQSGSASPSQSSVAGKPATSVAAPSGPADPWPRILTYNGANISVFQPQVESWVGNKLQAYAAVRVQTPQKKDTDYGVIWFSARTEVDKVNRVVTLDDFVLTRQNFPSLANNGAAYANTFILNLPWSHTIPLDLLESSLAVTNAADAQKRYPLQNDPPRIIFSITPAVLAIIDGAPVLRPSADNLQKVINTRALILFDPAKKMYYMALMDGWVEAPSVEGPWNPAKHDPTKAMDKIRQAAEANDQNQPLGNPQQSLTQAYKDGKAPAFYSTTLPAKFLVGEGNS